MTFDRRKEKEERRKRERENYYTGRGANHQPLRLPSVIIE